MAEEQEALDSERLNGMNLNQAETKQRKPRSDKGVPKIQAAPGEITLHLPLDTAQLLADGAFDRGHPQLGRALHAQIIGHLQAQLARAARGQ